MMTGLMLVAGSKAQADHGRRHAGLCAALMVAAQIAPAVTDCVFCRSHGHHGLDQALALFHASALLEARHGKHRRHRRQPGLSAGAQRCRALLTGSPRRRAGPHAARGSRPRHAPGETTPER